MWHALARPRRALSPGGDSLVGARVLLEFTRTCANGSPIYLADIERQIEAALQEAIGTLSLVAEAVIDPSEEAIETLTAAAMRLRDSNRSGDAAWWSSPRARRRSLRICGWS